MRKVLFLSIVILSMLCSCSNIEDEAFKHMKALMKECINRPDEAELVNTRAIYKSDSLCIVQFTLKAQDNEGNMVSIPMEYVYIDLDNFDGKRLKAESVTAIGDNFMSKAFNEGAGNGYRDDIVKQWKDAGYDLGYVVNHSVVDIKGKYRRTILKNVHYKSTASDIEDKLVFSAAWLKVMAHGREISNEKGKDIKL